MPTIAVGETGLSVRAKLNAMLAGGANAYADRASLVTAVSAGTLDDLADGGIVQWIVGDDVCAVRKSTGAVFITDMEDFAPVGLPIQLNAWGPELSGTLAGADTIGDSETLVHLAVGYCETRQYFGKLQWSSGYVRCDTTITYDNSLLIIGQGPQESFLHANHLNGPAIKIEDDWSGLHDIGITASASRVAGTATQGDYGVLFEGEDVASPSDRSLYSVLERFYIYGHPDDAVHVIGPAFTGSITDGLVSGVKGHGFYFDRGEKSGRSNLITSLISGICNITQVRFGNVDGHAICAGNPNGTYTGSEYSTPSLRIVIDNCEGDAGNDDTITYKKAPVFLRGSNHVMQNCGFSHTHANAWLAGRNLHYTNNRVLGSGRTVTIDPSTAVDTGTDVITKAGHGFEDDDSLEYGNGGGSDIGGLTDGGRVYVRDATSTTFKVALTRGGTAINLTSTGSGSAHTFKNGGHGVIIGTFNQLPTDGVYVTNMSVISPDAKLDPAVLITLPSGESTLPNNIHIWQAEMGNIRRLVDVDSTVTYGVTVDPSSDVNTGTETITSTDHEFANGMAVVYDNGGGSDMAGLTSGSTYYIIGATTNTFQVASTLYGSAVNITSTGSGAAHTFTRPAHLNQIKRIFVNNSLVPKLLASDATVNASTTLVNLADLRFDVNALERVYFDWEIEFDTNTTADIKFALTASNSGTIRYSAVSGFALDASGSIAAVPVKTSGQAITVNGAGSGTQRLVISGYCEASTATSTITPQFAQATSDVSDTVVKAGMTALQVRLA